MTLERTEHLSLGGIDAVVHRLSDDSEVVHVPRFLASGEASVLYQHCIAFPWERKPIRGVLTKRFNVWFASTPVTYAYSGQIWPPHKITPELGHLAKHLCDSIGTDFDSVLATLYLDGGAAVAFHRDNEAIFGPHPTIASLSLGATRTFEVEGARGRPREGVRLVLSDGDLVVMRGAFQENYRHRIKTASSKVGPRINLSFRKLVPLD